MRKLLLLIVMALAGVPEITAQTFLNFENGITGNMVCNPFQSGLYEANRPGYSGASWSVSHGTPTLVQAGHTYYDQLALEGSSNSASEGVFTNYTFLPSHKYNITLTVRLCCYNPDNISPDLKLYAANGLTHTQGSNCEAGTIPSGGEGFSNQLIMQMESAGRGSASLTVNNFTPNAQYNQIWLYTYFFYDVANTVVIDQITIQDLGVTGPCCPFSHFFAYNDPIVSAFASHNIEALGNNSMAATSAVTLTSANYVLFATDNVVIQPSTGVLLAQIAACPYSACRVDYSDTDQPVLLDPGFNQMQMEKITVYPNPSSGIFTIVSEDQIDNIAVSNGLGEVISSGKGNRVDLTEQPEGIYFISISSKGKTVVKKVFKTK